MNYEDNFENKETNRYSIKKIIPVLGRCATTFALAGVMATGLVGCGESASARNLGEVDPTIATVTITPESNLRSDHFVGHGEDANELTPVVEDMTIKNQGDIIVHEDEINGDWYGIPATYFEDESGNNKYEADPDGIVWVNTQGALITKTTDKNS